MKLIVAIPLVLAFLFVHVSANASDSDVVIIPKNQSRENYEDSSEYARMGKKFSVLHDSALNRTAGGGIALGYLINSQSQILLEAHRLSLRGNLLDWFSGSVDSLEGTSVGTHYKHFFGNSFFVRGGAEYRTLSFDRQYNGSIFSAGTSSEKSSFAGNSLAAIVGIGNTWQWNYLTLGFDWYRMDLPVTSQVTRESIIANDKTNMEDQKDHYFKGTTGSAAFHIGLTF